MLGDKFIGRIICIVCSLLIIGETGIASPIPSDIKTIVVFVFVDKDANLIPYGTGFFVGVKHPNDPNVCTPYLVTAKHVISKPNSTEYFDKIFLRLNKKDGSSEIVMLPIVPDGNNKTVFVHNDPSVDIAVIPCLPNENMFDFKVLPDEKLTTQEEYKNLSIREGSDVFFVGLFTPYLGAEKNYPVVRFGRVALVTNEKILFNGKQQDLYLIEVGSYGGNSGSPVFFYLGADREPGTLYLGSPVLKLAGIMEGTFLDAKEIKVIETKTTPFALSNMGIAAVVPSYKLHEILFGDELKKKRGF
jgi:Trypsin-like peptidase domain